MPGLHSAAQDPNASPARLRALLEDELAHGDAELQKTRSGYTEPVTVAFGLDDRGHLVAALPVPAATRADPAAATDRAWRVVAAVVAALKDGSDLQAPGTADDLRIQAGVLDDSLALSAGPGDAELAQLAYEEQIENVDRLRSHAVTLPQGLIAAEDWRAPIGQTHPLKVAEAVARMGGDPAGDDEHMEDLVLRLLEPAGAVARPHEDPDPARRVARRILQRLDGMGKWGGFHTDFAHLARGFRGNERALADSVGEALLDAGLLAEKPSVGQRHVFLNPRRAGEIRRLIDDGEVPTALRLPAK